MQTDNRYTHAHTHTHTRAHEHTYTHTRTHKHACAHTRTHTHTWAHTHAHIHIHTNLSQLTERNPELSAVLNDPQLLRQSLQMASNPNLMREHMRTSDRAPSNIEAMPEGFNALRRMFENVQVCVCACACVCARVCVYVCVCVCV